MHPIDRGLRFIQHAALTDVVHHADNRVPMALLVVESPKLESLAQRRLAGIVAIRKRLVDDCHWSIGLVIRRAEESALAQMRSNGRKVVAAHVPDECDLVGYSPSGLAVQPIKSRAGEVSERDEVDETAADGTRNRTHLLPLRI